MNEFLVIVLSIMVVCLIGTCATTYDTMEYTRYLFQSVGYNMEKDILKAIDDKEPKEYVEYLYLQYLKNCETSKGTPNEFVKMKWIIYSNKEEK